MFDSHPAPRPLRWYEWLAILLVAFGAARAQAGTVYRCSGDRGSTLYQDRPCAAATDQSVVALAPAPAYAQSPHYALEREETAKTASHAPRPRTASRRASPAAESSYECRTADGQVFYRHSACPHSVPAIDHGNAPHRGRSTAAKSVAVTSTRISREDACYELRRGGAAGRSGRQHDQDVSTYDKNLGRDLCH